jgi:hypothetical protein
MCAQAADATVSTVIALEPAAVRASIGKGPDDTYIEHSGCTELHGTVGLRQRWKDEQVHSDV